MCEKVSGNACVKGANTKSFSTLRTTNGHNWDAGVICDKGCLLNFFMRNLLRNIYITTGILLQFVITLWFVIVR